MDSKENIVGCIICEDTVSNVEFKLQSENKNGFVLAEGIVQRGNETNRNRRYYPMEELERAVKSPRVQELVKSGNFKGEAGHPLDKTLARQSKVDPQCEQVWYTKLWTEGDLVKAHFRGTNNDLGRAFNDDLKDGQLPSFSLRALGSLVNENGRMTVRNMQMICYDRVYFPSHSSAYTTKVLTTEQGRLTITPTGKEYIFPDYMNYRENEIKTIQESGNTPEYEDYVIKLTQDEINNFILTESANMRGVINNFDIFYESLKVNPNSRTATMKTRLGDTINIMLETAVSREIMNGFR